VPAAEPDGDLAPERDHLRRARAALHRMREQVESLTAQGGDAVSTEYLKASLYRRALALADDPDVPLFFGRIDQHSPTERFYVGRRHVQDEHGDPMVVDWRAAVSRAFYRASPAEPMRVSLRRRFGFDAGRLTSYEDERLDHGPLGTSRILLEEIERPRVGPMRDIVATIQPDQDELVRADLNRTVCVQGAPGTGKTAVGLHRAAYLLYAHRDRLIRTGVLVVGPNRAFLRYIAGVLPALGELDVRQLTIDELPGHVPIRSVDPDAVAVLKGDERLAELVRRAVHLRVRTPADGLVVDFGARRWRLSAAELATLVQEVTAADWPYATARTQLGRRVAELVRRRSEEAGGAPGDRSVARLAKSPVVQAFLDAHWPAVDPVRTVFALLAEPAALAEAADGLLTDDEQTLLRWPSAPTGPRRAPWSAADAFLVDEAVGLVHRTPSYGHLVVDEAQDLSAMQCRALARRCVSGSATLLGDLAQTTAPWGLSDWDRILRGVGKPDAQLVRLTTGYRVPAQVLAFSNRLLPALGPELAAAQSLRAGADGLQVLAVDPDDRDGRLVATTRTARQRGGSVGVIAADAAVPAVVGVLAAGGVDPGLAGAGLDHPVTVVPASLAKGLEFDHVVVVEPAEIVAAEPRGLNRLYVVLTRAVSTLTVLHARPLPAALAA
jgi:hypothetical protein